MPEWFAVLQVLVLSLALRSSGHCSLADCTSVAQDMSPFEFCLADGRQLYVNDEGRVSAWKDHDPQWDHRRRWTADGGTIRLLDGRQLYCTTDGRVFVAKAGEADNTDAARRAWTVDNAGVIQLPDGRQLYAAPGGWAAAAPWGSDRNDDRARNTWARAAGPPLLAEAFNEPHLPDALRQAQLYAGPSGFVASLPQLLRARATADYGNDVWNRWYTANTEESVVRAPDGRLVLVVVHGGGVLGDPDRIERMYRAGLTSKRAGKLSAEEARALLRGAMPDGAVVPVYPFEDFLCLAEDGPARPRRYAVVLDFAAARDSPNGYVPFEGLDADPLMIARAGGVQPLRAYLDKAQRRRNTSKMGVWHPYADIPEQELAQPQVRVVFLAGNRGGVGSEGESSLAGYDVDYGIGGDANLHNRGRYVAVAPQPRGGGLLPFVPAPDAAPLEAAVVFETHLAKGLRTALNWAGDAGLVLSLPQLLEARVRAAFDSPIWAHEFTAHSEDCACVTPEGRPVVVTVHGGGVLGAPDRVERAFRADPGLTGGYAARVTEREAHDLLRGRLPDGTAIPVFEFEGFCRRTEPLPLRYAVVTGLDVARTSKRGYHSLDALRHDPMVIAHAGGVAAAAAYLDKLRQRGATTLGHWHPFNFGGFAAEEFQCRVLFLAQDGDILAAQGLVNMARFVAAAPRDPAASVRRLEFE